MMPQAGADGSTTMIIGLGLLFIAYVLASFAIIQGLVFPHLAQGPPAAAILLLVVGSYGGGLTLLTMTLLVLYRSEALTPKTLRDRARSAPLVAATNLHYETAPFVGWRNLSTQVRARLHHCQPVSPNVAEPGQVLRGWRKGSVVHGSCSLVLKDWLE
jgi:hypothetical protein